MKYIKNWMKQFKKTNKIIASSFFKKIVLFFLIFLCVAVIFLKVGYKKYLIISHQETKQVYNKVEINTNDIIEYKWIHSFEHIPWTEEFKVLNNNQLRLEKITVAGFGAGIPENKGKTTVENGIIIMNEINEDFKEINWINSNTAVEYIHLNKEEIVKGSDLPHHQPLKLVIKEKLSIWARIH